MPSLCARTLADLGAAVAVPSYDRTAVRVGVVHLGVGNFHRAHQAVVHDELLAQGALDWGICGVGVLERDRPLHAALAAQDGLFTLLVKHPDGRLAPRVIGSLVELLLAPDDPEAVVARLAAPQTRVVTLTITEGGYRVDDATGAFDADDAGVAHDLRHPSAPRTAFGLVVEALRRRRAAGVAPFAVVSCDNLQGSGDVARAAFTGFARLRDAELAAWMGAEVRFPNAVVDRITPATTDLDRAALRDLHGVTDAAPVVCEPFWQWVVEDPGPAGSRPPYEAAGVRVVEDARPHELMKLRLLNAGHQVLAYLGALLGHELVHVAARDPDLRAFLEGFLDVEAVPTLTGVGPEALATFRGPLLDRFGNPAIADTLERLATDASDRLPKFVLPIVRERLAAGERADRCALVVAAWRRVLSGADDAQPPLRVVDRRRDDLVARARQDDPAALLGLRAVFGELGDREAFVASVRDAAARLDRDGARGALRSS